MAAAHGGPGSGVGKLLNRVVIVAALGYFVDIYDLILFSIVRRASLMELGVAEVDLLPVGAMLLSWQMGGLLVGGVLWGILGDKRGRLTVLFGSILLYSLANLANGFVALAPRDLVIPVYAALRFVAGVGLAGELGAAITLVSEVMTKEARGYGAAVVAGVGILGGLFAYGVSEFLHWQAAYIVGGFLGLGLLGARFAMRDSGMFESLRRKPVRRGDFFMLFSSRDRFSRYAYTLLVGLPIWFVVGVLITFSPELAPLIGVTGPVSAGAAVAFTYLGLSIGDLASGILSGVLRSRRWVFVGFLGYTSGLIFLYTLGPPMTPGMFYTLAFLLGLGIGYWAVFNINAAEQFGTNLRATVATTAPNFVRGSLVPILFVFQALAAWMGEVPAALVVGQATVIVALVAVWRLKETYGTDLDYLEGEAEDAATPVQAPAPVPLLATTAGVLGEDGESD